MKCLPAEQPGDLQGLAVVRAKTLGVDALGLGQQRAGFVWTIGGQPPYVQLNRLSEGGGTLIGVDDTAEYEAAEIDLVPGQRVLVVSDGIIEQPNPTVKDRNEQFGVEGVLSASAKIKEAGDELKTIYKAVKKHTDGHPLADDATVLMVQYLG